MYFVEYRQFLGNCSSLCNYWWIILLLESIEMHQRIDLVTSRVRGWFHWLVYNKNYMCMQLFI